ncbi:MAG: FUSC family protein [Candidatus Nanopelagicales bacterium]|jgi:hypothetical protein|nr:FUSC family protein [Candidatus Nanopelagicales bacterium]
MALFTRPAEGTIKFAVILLVAIMIPSSIATSIGGNAAGMAFGIASGFTMAVTPFATNAQGIGSAFLAAALGAMATAADDSPLLIAGLMLLSALLLALTNQHSAGLMTLAPAIVIIFGPTSLVITWQETFLYLLAGGLFGWLLTRLFKFEAEPTPVPTGVAWRHAVVLGVMSAITIYWALANNINHGYWVTVTLVVALRPLPDQRATTLRDRLLGTLFGAVLAFVAIVALPSWGALLVAAVCLPLLAAYSMSGNYFMQTLFLTPMLLIFTTIGDEAEGISATAERVFYTIVGVAVGFAAAWALARWDRAAGDAPEVSTPA